jgi:DNA-binding ferritin-like protein
MIGRLIALLFFARDVAHREHLKTTSYAQHVALNEFYEAIVSNADSIAEAYQGRFGIIDDIPMITMDLTGDPAAKLEKILAAFEKIRYTAVEKSDTTIQNLIDEAVAQFLSTLYKLNNLK